MKLENYKGYRRYKPFVHFNKEDSELQVGRLVVWVDYIGYILQRRPTIKTSGAGSYRRLCIGRLVFDLYRKYIYNGI
jgi:hypothetical protein